MPVESEWKILNKNLVLISYCGSNKLRQLGGFKPHTFTSPQSYGPEVPDGLAGPHTLWPSRRMVPAFSHF